MAGIVPRFPQPRRESQGFEGPVGEHNTPTGEKSGAYRSQFQHGDGARVRVPESAKDLAMRLSREIKTIGSDFQQPITDILRKIRDENPEAMPDVLNRLSEFFASLRDRLLGNREEMKNIVDELVTELEEMSRKKIQ